MTSSLLIAPHSDDEVLFASFIAARYRPAVVVVAGDPDPSIRLIRERESREALVALGVPPGNVAFPAGLVERALTLEAVTATLGYYDHQGLAQVFAPAVEEDGHPEHSLVGAAAASVFGDRVRPYLTYTRSGGRSRSDQLIDPPTPDAIGHKLAALSEYGSQIRHPARRPWFYDQLDMREWWA